MMLYRIIPAALFDIAALLVAGRLKYGMRALADSAARTAAVTAAAAAAAKALPAQRERAVAEAASAVRFFYPFDANKSAC